LTIGDVIHERGPMTVAAFMEFALYDPQDGYYARAAQRSGRAGDFFTSVDVGPLFGELLEEQIFEMATLLRNVKTAKNAEHDFSPRDRPRISERFDLVEAGAGNGRLAADILHAARRRNASYYESIDVHLVEASAPARAAQPDTLGEVAGRLVSSAAELPERFEGVLIANELLDALPTHQVVMRADGLKEVYVSDRRGALHLSEAPLSTPALQTYLDRVGVKLEPGWRVEINLGAVEWVRAAARRLTRGFMILIDYGHEAHELYSATHSGGTLTSFAAHRSSGADTDVAAASWLDRPGEQDITAHVDFTSVRAAAEAEGMTTIALLDQTYFLLGLVERRLELSNQPSPFSNQQLKTLVMPGGLGSTMKVLILGKGVGTPALAGCSFKVRVT
jgi:SAM-dependent MidA family methyltransferase